MNYDPFEKHFAEFVLDTALQNDNPSDDNRMKACVAFLTSRGFDVIRKNNETNDDNIATIKREFFIKHETDPEVQKTIYDYEYNYTRKHMLWQLVEHLIVQGKVRFTLTKTRSRSEDFNTMEAGDAYHMECSIQVVPPPYKLSKEYKNI